MVVVLFPVPDAEPTLEPAALEELAKLRSRALQQALRFRDAEAAGR
jgi:hypothetical protein